MLTKARMEKPITSCPVLHLAFELGRSHWKLGVTGLGWSPRVRKIRVGNLEALAREIEAAKRRFAWTATAVS